MHRTTPSTQPAGQCGFPGPPPALKGVTASQCHWAGRAGTGRAGWEDGGGGQFLVLLLAAVPFSCWDTHATLRTDLLLVPVQDLAPRLLPEYPEKPKKMFFWSIWAIYRVQHGSHGVQGCARQPSGAWSHWGRARRPGSISTALLCQISSPPGSAPAGTHVRRLEQHGQQGLALLSVINRALFDPSLSGAAAGCYAYQGMCCAFSGFQLCQAWWQETEPRDMVQRCLWPPWLPVTTPCGGCSRARMGTWLWRDVGSSAPLEMLFDFAAFLHHLFKLSEPLPRQGAQEVPYLPCKGPPGREQGSPAPGQGLLSLVLCMDWMGVRESSRNHPVPWHTPGLLCLQPLLHPHRGTGLSLCGVCREAAGRAQDPPVNSEHP